MSKISHQASFLGQCTFIVWTRLCELYAEDVQRKLSFDSSSTRNIGMMITSAAQFEEWLGDNAWFQDGCVLSVGPVPGSLEASLPSTVIMELAYQIAGNFKAHSTSVSRLFRIRASGIERYYLPDGESPSSGHCLEGISQVESCCPIAFQMDTPGMLTLHCATLEVEELPNRIETVRPVSPTEPHHRGVPSFSRVKMSGA
ncbi:MAG: hypothetical protein K0U93_12165 [Gammaproteobacteria bacterium]|nr:hypothetical protein [Gammaproteobacteria bacterium]